MVALFICWYISMGLMTCVISKVYRLAVEQEPFPLCVTETRLILLALIAWPLVLVVGVVNLHKRIKQ